MQEEYIALPCAGSIISGLDVIRSGELHDTGEYSMVAGWRGKGRVTPPCVATTQCIVTMLYLASAEIDVQYKLPEANLIAAAHDTRLLRRKRLLVEKGPIRAV